MKDKDRTLEDALQEALDNTTPETPGIPETWRILKYELDKDEEKDDKTPAGWI